MIDISGGRFHLRIPTHALEAACATEPKKVRALFLHSSLKAPDIEESSATSTTPLVPVEKGSVAEYLRDAAKKRKKLSSQTKKAAAAAAQKKGTRAGKSCEKDSSAQKPPSAATKSTASEPFTFARAIKTSTRLRCLCLSDCAVDKEMFLGLPRTVRALRLHHVSGLTDEVLATAVGRCATELQCLVVATPPGELGPRLPGPRTTGACTINRPLITMHD